MTLLFSVERYEQVIEAYCAASSAARRAGQPLDGIASVASFFVSRVDAKADAVLAPTRRCAAGSRSPTPSARTRATWSASRAQRWEALRRAGASAAAAAVGEHRHQGSGLLGRALRRAS